VVGPRVGLINTMSNTRLDRDGVKAKFDVHPEQIVDYLALVGDSSDNIPGVTGVGPKTAAKWLNQYRTLDELIAHAGNIAGKVGENLRNELPMLELSRKLATIDTALALDLDADALAAVAPDVPRLRELYTRLELRALLKALAPSPEPPLANADPAVVEVVVAAVQSPGAPAVAAVVVETPVLAREYRQILSQEALDAWLAKLGAAPLICLDTLTDSLDYMQARIVGLSFSVTPGEAAYVPLAHDYAGAPHQLDRAKVLAAFKPLLEDPTRSKVGHRLKFDAHVLQNHGIAVAELNSSTSILRCCGSRCWTSTNAMPLSTGMLAKKLLKACKPPADAPMPRRSGSAPSARRASTSAARARPSPTSSSAADPSRSFLARRARDRPSAPATSRRHPRR